MLPKNKRITVEGFTQVLEKGRSWHCPSLSLRVMKLADPAAASKFSFFTPKKAVKLAVARNLLKRRGNAAIERLYPSVKPGVAGVFFYKKGADLLSAEEIARDVALVLRNAGLIQ